MRLSRRRLIAICYVLALVIVLYWVAWYARRSLVATESTPVYLNFEQAFPLADGFIVLFLVLAARALRRGRSSAVLFLLLGAGAGLYLGAMDVLFDIEHGIWSHGANGIVELVINVVTFAAAVLLSRWVWTHRRELDPATDLGDVGSSSLEG